MVFRHEREIILLETRPVLHRSMQARFGLARRALICLLSLGLILGSLLAAAAPSEGQAWTATWTQKSDASPGPRAPVDMTFDTVQGRAILFGGTASVPLNDVWQYDTAADRWLQVQPAVACPSDPTQPTGRVESSLGYDPFNQLVWIFGGVGVGCSSTRTAGKGTTTTAILDPSLPATSVDFYKGWSVTVGNGSTTVTAYDPAMKMLTLAAPLSGTRRWTSYVLSPPSSGVTFSYSPGTMSWGAPTGSQPATRLSPALAYSTQGAALVMFGGQGLSDTWALDVKTKSWKQMMPGQTAASPPGLTELATAMAYDSDDDAFVLFGGCLCTGGVGPSSGDTWVYRLSTNTWTKVTPAVSPQPRQGHNLVYDSGNKRVVLFGGVDPMTGTYFNDLWIYSFTANTWTMVFPVSSPPARRVAAMVYDQVQQRTILYGGEGIRHNAPVALTDVWSLQLNPPASGNSTPALTSLSPSTAADGGPGFTLTVTGANFASTSVVRWNGANRNTTYVRSSQLQASVAAADIASAGSAQISVSTAGSGVGTSNALAFTITAPTPAPVLSSISPAAASAGGAAFTLTATGSNFTNSSIVQVNGAGRTTTFVSSTQLTAAIPASDIAAAGTPSITVFTPAPGGGTSAARSLTVARVNPTPNISSLSPASVTAGSAAFTLTVTGTGFAAGATATVGGQARTVTVDSATQVRIALQATDVASQGTPTVVVTNPTSCANAMCVSNGVYLNVAAPSTSNTPTTTGGTTSTTTGGTNSTPTSGTSSTTTGGTTSTTTGATDPSTPPSSTSGTSGTTSSPSGASVVASPVLYFTDLASGPRSGNKDTSRGQIANQDGALVTVWGQNLGTSQGTSTITLGGVAPAAIYYWGNATAPNCGAATLFNAYQKLQCIIFQVNHATAPGAQNIVVTVGGVATNALSFTVMTSGAIYTVAPVGGDFTSIQTALDTAALGDIIYVKNGSDVLTGVTPPYSTVPTGAPLALVVYPGHSVQVGDATHRAFDLTHSQSGKQMVYSKFSAWGPDVVVMVEQDGRFVGNLVQAPNGVGSTGAVTSDTYQAAPNRAVLGNEITNVGTTNPAAWDNLYHTIYFGGLRDGGSLVTGVEIGWNYIHDNKAFRAINLFSQLTSADSVLGGVNIHDNVIVNQQGQAVLLGRGLVGTLQVYNNLFINTGQDYSLDSSNVVSAAYTAIQVLAGYLSGWAGSTSPVTVDIFNNTMLNSGAAASNHRGVLYYDPDNAKLSNVTLKFRNNLVDQATGVGYMVGSAQTPATDATNIRQNLWYGAGAAPAWDTGSVNADPLLVSAVSSNDLHLQAGSPAIGTGANLTGGGLGLLDFDGRPRPASGAWSIGAYQFGTQAAGASASGQAPTSTGTVAPIPTATSSSDATTTATTTPTSTAT